MEFFGWIRDGFKINGHPYRRFIVMLLLTIVPMFAILPVKSTLENAFSSPAGWPAAAGDGGYLVPVGESAEKHKTEENATWLDALIVGIGQCFAVLPGLSRSGTPSAPACSAAFRVILPCVSRSSCPCRSFAREYP